jgi:threonine/homoserine/homoserine lactone efflux protein
VAISSFFAFLGVSLVVIGTPGQDTALTIRNTLAGGRVGGVFTAIGIVAGQAVWTCATSAGIGALLVASERALVALKLAGSAYLVFLGVQAVFGAARSRHGKALVAVEPASTQTPLRLSPVAALRQGLLSNLGNPKMLVFFTSLLPQYASLVSGLLVLGFVFCSLTLIWLLVYTFAVARASALLCRSRVRRSVEALTGVVLVALGLRLATEQRP